MRILNFIRTLNPKGGGPMEAIRSMSVAFREIGSSNEILTLDAPDSPWLADFSVPVHAIDGGKAVFGYARGVTDWLDRNVGRFDAVISHGIWNYPSLATWRTLKGSDTPWFVVPHGSLDPWFNSAFPAKRVKKTVYWRAFASQIMADATGVLFTSEEELRRSARSFAPYRCNALRVDYGVLQPPGPGPAQRKAFLGAFPHLRGKRMLLSLGRIVRQKGCDVSIAAFANVARQDPELRLVFAGPDQIGWQAALEQEAAALGVADRIIWTGNLAGDLKWGAFRAAEAFLLPSHMENFGVVVAESLACGTPVLISENVQIWREIVADGAGLVSQNTVEDTTRMLRRWLDLVPQTRADARGVARQCFERRFTMRGAAQSWLRTIAGAVAAREGRPRSLLAAA